jgi:hypothetical protein
MRPRLAAPSPWYRCLLASLALAVVLSHLLGLMHRSLHGPHTQVADTAVTEHANHGAGDCDSASWVADLFAAHDDESKCRLFDSLTQGGPQAGSVAVFLAPASPGLLLSLAGEALARQAALFEARGPPVH